MRDGAFPYLPKDFIQTKEGLIFAVVSYQPQDGKVGCFLRYIPSGDSWQKVSTVQANQLLQDSFPQYLYHSKQFDAAFHAVLTDDVTLHYQPEIHLQKILQREPCDEIEVKLHKLIPILKQFGVQSEMLGLTGSMLINQQKQNSDIDLVVYGRQAFQQTRLAVKQAIEHELVHKLDTILMQDNFDRRSSELELDEFTWHEDRKFNKAVIDDTKFDIGMVCLQGEGDLDVHQYQKLGPRVFRTQVVDDQRAFDFPACYLVADTETPAVFSYTHTYVGQAQQGEIIEVSGMVERNVETGHCRMIIGSSREAHGEYIRVIK